VPLKVEMNIRCKVGYSYDAIYYKFTGKERDSESELDEFVAR
jgi:hypothetical protein